MTYNNKPWPEKNEYKRHNTPRLNHSQCFFPTEQSHTHSVPKSCHSLQHKSTCCFGGTKPSDEAHWQLVPLSPMWKCSDVDAPPARSPHHYRGQCLAEQECAAATLENRQRGERRRVPRQSLVLRGALWRPWLSALSPWGYSNPNTLGTDRHVRQRNLSRAVVWDALIMSQMWWRR